MPSKLSITQAMYNYTTGTKMVIESCNLRSTVTVFRIFQSFCQKTFPSRLNLSIHKTENTGDDAGGGGANNEIDLSL